MKADERATDTEYHDGDEPSVCVGQWCCGCTEHPIGKPWGWNWRAWQDHYEVCPRRLQDRRAAR